MKKTIFNKLTEKVKEHQRKKNEIAMRQIQEKFNRK